MKAEDVTKTELKKVAKEFNEQMGLEPPILPNLKVSALKEKCIEAAAHIDLEQDEYSEQVWEVLDALGCDPREPVGCVDEEADAAVEEALEDTLVEDFKAAKKLAELKELAKEWDCFDNLDLDSYAGLQGVRELKMAMLECMPDEVQKQLNPKPVEKTTSKKASSTTSSKKIAKNEWAAADELSAVNAGTKVAKALDFIKEQKMTGIKIVDLAAACDWREDLAKSYLTQNIVQLGYGVKVHDDNSFDLQLPTGEKTIKDHNVK